MSGSGGSAVSRSNGVDRFYNPPMRRYHKSVLHQQQPLPQLQKAAARSATPVDGGNRIDSEDSQAALSKQPPVSAHSAPPPLPLPLPNLTNLDRFLESVAPTVAASEVQVNARRRKTKEPKLQQPFYCLSDLWESFNEWSVYGVGVPLLLNGVDHVQQYYVPFLSGIQLYVDPAKHHLRVRSGEEGGAEAPREAGIGGGVDFAPDKRSKSNSEKVANHPNMSNLDPQRTDRSSRGSSVKSFSSDETENSSSPGLLLFEYLENETPHHRKPLFDKIGILASQCPELRKCRSCDLLPSSWISVAWYPIYRIPVGPTLRDLDASFLTFHSLSTHPTFHGVSERKIHPSADVSSKISLPVFGLASYKFIGSMLSPCGPHEREQENSLVQTAADWLQQLHVSLPDFQFFRSHSRR